jgi:hypothetical protein
MGGRWSCFSSHESDEVYLLLRKWIPEFIDTYGEIDEKYYCPYDLFLAGIVEYIYSVKHDKKALSHLPEQTLILLTDQVLCAIYSSVIHRKGVLKKNGGYLHGLHLKRMP